MPKSIRLSEIVFDAGTQIRAAINEQVVAEYAERMTEGVQFPPVILFHDGNRYYMADGFHRAMAAQRSQFREIDAEVQPGTKTDALWFALGANKTNGHRMTQEDKRHAVALAFHAWPERSATEIAAQLGVHQTFVSRQREQVKFNLPSRVTGKDGKSYPASRPSKTVDAPVATPPPFKSRAAVQDRRERMRTMAAEGYTSRQIAATLGISEEGCRTTLRKDGIDVPADRVTRHTHHHDSNRILERIVQDAENLTAGAELIDFSEVDGERLGEWLDSLNASRRALAAFIRRVEQEHKKHVEAA